jgi:hypothetical protein
MFLVTFRTLFVTTVNMKVHEGYDSVIPVTDILLDAERHAFSVSSIKMISSLCLQPLWSSVRSSWLQIQRSLVRFPALPDFLRNSGSGTGSTQPREGNWRATWMEKLRLGVWKTQFNGRGDPLRWPRDTLYPQKLALTSPLRTKATEFSLFTHSAIIVSFRDKQHDGGIALFTSNSYLSACL